MAAVSPTASGPLGLAAQRPPPLRLAVFADTLEQHGGLVDTLARLATAGVIELRQVSVLEAPGERPAWLWRLGERVVRHLGESLGGHLGHQPLIHPLAEHGGARQAWGMGDLRRLAPTLPLARHTADDPASLAAWHAGLSRLAPLDVILVLGALDDGAFETLARYGVWRPCFGPTHDPRPTLAGWPEAVAGAPVSSAGLRVRMWPGAHRLLAQTHSRTQPFSPARNRAHLLARVPRLIERELRRLHREGEARLCSPGLPLPPPRPAPLPDNGTVLRGWARLAGRIARRALDKATGIEQWALAYRLGPPPTTAELAGLHGFTRLVPPPDRIWADPFPVTREGRQYIFFEELPFASNTGHIAAIEIRADGGHGPVQQVLADERHLSYPFLIDYRGELFMIPESGARRSVELWRCRRFPDDWVREAVLLADVHCADATLHRGEDRWWLFVTLGAEGCELYDELHLFHAPGLGGPWQPHPGNPVKTDVRSARPAGRLYVDHGHLYRPAQICAPRYGSGIALARILELTPTRYRETVVDRILPAPGSGILGIHTVNRSRSLSVADWFFRRPRW